MKFKLLQLQGSSHLYIDNLYMFYMPICSPVHRRNIVTIAMSTSHGSCASSKIESSNMPYELCLFASYGLHRQLEAIPYPSQCRELIFHLKSFQRKKQLAGVCFKSLASLVLYGCILCHWAKRTASPS